MTVNTVNHGCMSYRISPKDIKMCEVFKKTNEKPGFVMVLLFMRFRKLCKYVFVKIEGNFCNGT